MTTFLLHARMLTIIPIHRLYVVQEMLFVSSLVLLDHWLLDAFTPSFVMVPECE